jgi:hypothetical protein
VGLTFAYALAFLLYAILRSSLTLAATVNPDAGLLYTLIANATSLLIAVLTITFLMVIVTAVLGIITAIAVYGLLSTLNAHKDPSRAVIIGSATCLGVVLLLNLTLQKALGFSWSAMGGEAYLFWLGFPSLIYIVAGGVSSWQLNTWEGNK